MGRKHTLTHTHRLPAAPRLSGAAHPPEEIGILPGTGHCANETFEGLDAAQRLRAVQAEAYLVHLSGTRATPVSR